MVRQNFVEPAVGKASRGIIQTHPLYVVCRGQIVKPSLKAAANEPAHLELSNSVDAKKFKQRAA